MIKWIRLVDWRIETDYSYNYNNTNMKELGESSECNQT